MGSPAVAYYAFYTLGNQHSRNPITNARWLDRGNWQCDIVADGPLPSCRRHDVAYGSLQKFVGNNDASELDRTWNPRNKALADAKFWADIREWGCLGGNLTGRVTFCLIPSKRVMASVYFGGVARINNKGWPVTQQDLEHARVHGGGATAAVSSHAFVDCASPVPTISGLSVSQDSDGDYQASWSHTPCCVSDIVIDEMVLAWYAFFDNGEVGRHVQTLSNGAATSAEFSIGEYSELTPYAVGVYAYLIPDDIEYGGGWYQNWAWTYLGQ